MLVLFRVPKILPPSLVHPTLTLLYVRDRFFRSERPVLVVVLMEPLFRRPLMAPVSYIYTRVTLPEELPILRDGHVILVFIIFTSSFQNFHN